MLRCFRLSRPSGHLRISRMMDALPINERAARRGNKILWRAFLFPPLLPSCLFGSSEAFFFVHAKGRIGFGIPFQYDLPSLCQEYPSFPSLFCTYTEIFTLREFSSFCSIINSPYINPPHISTHTFLLGAFITYHHQQYFYVYLHILLHL